MGINKKGESDDFFTTIVAFFKWLKIFISPLLLFGFIGLGILLSAETELMRLFGMGLIFLGFVCGMLLAEYVRRKHGLIEFDSQIASTPDIDKWLEEERKKLKTD